MELSELELEELRKLRTEPEADDIRYKQIIKQKLLANNKIIYLLHNKELEDESAEPDEYFGINILPYYLISPTQHKVMNFVCFETSVEEVSRGNSVMKIQQIIFYILCHHDDINVRELSSPRHDMLASVIIQAFQGCNDFGTQLKLMSNRPSVVDTDYASRTLVFEQITTNSIVNSGKVKNLRVGY